MIKQENLIRIKTLPFQKTNLNIVITNCKFNITHLQDNSIQVAIISNETNNFFVTNYKLLVDENNEKYFIVNDKKLYLKNFN